MKKLELAGVSEYDIEEIQSKITSGLDEMIDELAVEFGLTAEQMSAIWKDWVATEV